MSFSIIDATRRRSIGRRIRLARERFPDFNTDDLVEIMGGTLEQWMDIEHGEIDPTALQLVQISECLGVSADSLMDPFVIAGEVTWRAWRAPFKLPVPLWISLEENETWFQRMDSAQEFMEPWVGMWRWLLLHTPPNHVDLLPWTFALSWPKYASAADVHHRGIQVGQVLQEKAPTGVSLSVASEHVLSLPVWWIISPEGNEHLQGGLTGSVEGRPVIILRGDLPDEQNNLAVALGIFHALNTGGTAFSAQKFELDFAQGVLEGFSSSAAIDIQQSPRVWAPSMAMPLQRAITSGQVSARKAACVLKMPLPTLASWLTAHGLSPGFDL